jgi:hypothetical protein
VMASTSRKTRDKLRCSIVFLMGIYIGISTRCSLFVAQTLRLRDPRSIFICFLSLLAQSLSSPTQQPLAFPMEGENLSLSLSNSQFITICNSILFIGRSIPKYR